MGREPDGDEGFTLIETLMALTLVIITMASAGPFFIGSLQAAARQRNEQYAVQLANMAIEQVRALKGSSLLTGRGSTAVRGQWDDAPPAVRSYLTTMSPAADTNAAATDGANAAIPTTTQAMTVDGNAFDRTIYIGACDVRIGRGECRNPDDQKVKDENWLGTQEDLQFFRAVVYLTWADRNCSGGTCDYLTSTLVSRGTEPRFDFHRPNPQVDPDQTIVFYRGQTRTERLKASGGELPNRWSLTGFKPPIVGFTVDGQVTNDPNAAVGTYKPVATVTDQRDISDTHTITVLVVLPPTVAAPASVRSHVGDIVTQQLTGTNGVKPYTYAVDALPPGLTLNPDTGAISGAPTTPGSTTVNATITDVNNVSGSVTYTHTVYPALTLDEIPDQTIALGSAVGITPVAAGGDGANTFSATGLPAGVKINTATGALSGIATVPGRYLPEITVADGLGGTAKRRFALVITTTSKLVFTSPSLLAPDQTSASGKSVSLPVSDNGAALGLVPLVTATGLPDGLSLKSGAIQGTPKAPGTSVVTLTSVSGLQSSVLTFVWTVT